MSGAAADMSRVDPCRPWGIWASLLWGAAAIAAWFGAQLVLAALAIEWIDGDGSVNVAESALVVFIVTLGAMPAGLLVPAIAARMAGCRIADYLALRMPPPRYLVIGLATLAVLIPLVDLLSWMAGYPIAPQFVTNLYRDARDQNVLPLLVLGLAVGAPVVEEVLFRGLLLPGLAASRLGPPGAIALTSIVWAAMHLQYQPFYLVQVIALGVAFGWLRWRSGSTVLTIGLHAIVNLTSLVQAGIVVEWMSS